jgi:nucleotide-binding universal stress UspA family protein
MFPFKRILFPVDFSADSISAAEYAAAMARRFQAELTVLNVVSGHQPYQDLNDVSLEATFAVDIAWNEIRERDAALKMSEFISAHLQGIQAKSRISRGDPAKAIVEHAESHNIDLIIMPTHGFGGFRRMLLGSTTAKVLHDVNCPVFTSTHVESSAQVSDAPFRTVVCALDLKARSESILRWAAQFTRFSDARLAVLHVTPEIVPGQWGYLDSNIQEDLRKDTTERLTALLDTTDTQADMSIEAGAVANTIRAFAQSNAADLVIIGRHSGSGIMGKLRDTAYAIIRESPCPVISV